MTFHSGFVAILGRPNAGKSTLVNRLVGQKIAIVSPKPQTTRNRIQGIINLPGAQVVLIDTPGLHRPDSALGRQMMEEVDQAIEGMDVLTLVVDASEAFGPGVLRALTRGRDFCGPVFLLLNKIDLIPKARLLPLMERCSREAKFTEIMPISAKKGDGCQRFLDVLVPHLPVSDPHFPSDQVTDQPERFLAAEIIREKAILYTYHEVPHAVAVLVERFEEKPKVIHIDATIHVERDAQKRILIGHGGVMLKKIGSEARRELEDFFGVKVFLELLVKVQRNWRDNPSHVRQIDWHHQLESLSTEQGDQLIDEAGRPVDEKGNLLEDDSGSPNERHKHYDQD
ncbi:MAG TPA: GTPase Era [Candidatus Dormibacteraeota bacterium]|nr:GTPase Era [Candidatus Dormibacteraeota bacterium]